MGLATWRTDESPTPCRLCLNKKKPPCGAVCHQQGKAPRLFRGKGSSKACRSFVRQVFAGYQAKTQPERLPYRDEP